MRHQPKWLRELGNTQNGVFAVNRDHRILTWNRAAANLLGYPAAEVIGRHCYETLSGRVESGRRFCGEDCPVFQCVRRNLWAEDVDLVMRGSSKQAVWVTLSTCTLPIGIDPVVVHTIRSARDHESADDQLHEMLASLQAYLSAQSGSQGGEEMPPLPAVKATPANGLAALGRRELEVLDLLSRGYSARQIAKRLGLSLLTIRSHIRNMLRKTGLHRQAQIVSMALRNKLT